MLQKLKVIKDFIDFSPDYWCILHFFSGIFEHFECYSHVFFPGLYKMKTKGKKKAPKDPLAPKHPLSSYLEFAVAKRQEVLDDIGPLSVGEVGKELGRRWKSLTAEEKQIYVTKSKENREKYEKELEEYKEEKEGGESSAIEAHPGAEPSQSGNPDENAEPLPSSSSASCSIDSDPPKAEDLGFAKQRGYSFHPAMKTGVFAKGTRIKVKYFGTGQTGVVDALKWIKFSSQAEARISTPRLKKDSAFRTGLDQLKCLMRKIEDGPNGVSSSGISFTNQSEGRRLKKLNKDSLQREEEENIKLMKQKIVAREHSPNKFGCRDCGWKNKFSHKAKAHARLCGTRRRIHIKKPKPSKYFCSGENCKLSFSFVFQLNKHYRYLCF